MFCPIFTCNETWVCKMVIFNVSEIVDKCTKVLPQLKTECCSHIVCQQTTWSEVTHFYKNSSFLALHFLVCTHLFSLLLICLFHFSFSYCEHPIGHLGSRHMSGWCRSSVMPRGPIWHMPCAVLLFPLCSNSSGTHSFTFGCLVAGRSHYSHPLWHGYSGCDVTRKCEAELLPRNKGPWEKHCLLRVCHS